MKSVEYLQGSDIKYYVFLAISVKIEQTWFTGNRNCSGTMSCFAQFYNAFQTKDNDRH